ncbi:MAG: glutamate--tRNA ligase family protein [Opitutales bacterium]
MPAPIHRPYRGRVAPTPTGYLHRGHARAFAVAWARARHAGGTLLYRDEDLDAARCQPALAAAAMEDLRWLGLDWEEGPDVGGPHAPYRQSGRRAWFHEVWGQLQATGAIYPSPHSRKDVAEALAAPHGGEGEAIFPVALRPPPGAGADATEAGEVNWRFRVPDGEAIAFVDACAGPQRFVAGEDFGDFLVWRRDGFPSYELAVVADDHAMGVTEVVRGADLLLSTARQLLLYRALGWAPPAWLHVPLVLGPDGRRLAKRAQSESLRALRERGVDPAALRETEIGAVLGPVADNSVSQNRSRARPAT